MNETREGGAMPLGDALDAAMRVAKHHRGGAYESYYPEAYRAIEDLAAAILSRAEPCQWPRGQTFRIRAEVLEGVTVSAALLEEDYEGRWVTVRETNDEHSTLDAALRALAMPAPDEEREP